MTKLKVGLLFGGRSGEHEVSINSSRAIAKALGEGNNIDKYEVLPVYIQKMGYGKQETSPNKFSKQPSH